MKTKRILCLLLALGAAAVLTACTGKAPDDGEKLKSMLAAITLPEEETVTAAPETTLAPETETTAAVETAPAEETTVPEETEPAPKTDSPAFEDTGWLLWPTVTVTGRVYDEPMLPSGTFGKEIDAGITSIRTLAFPAVADTTEGIKAVIGITDGAPETLEGIDITVDGYPAMHLKYFCGHNEDTGWCEDILVLADEAAYLFHTVTPADFFEENEAVVQSWMESMTLQLTEYACPDYLGNMVEEDLAPLLDGWWIYAGEDLDEDPTVIRFTADGRVYLSPEDYEDRDETTFYNEWAVDGDSIVFIQKDSEWNEVTRYSLLAAADGSSLCIRWDGDADSSVYLSSDNEDAAPYLEGTAYDRLYTGPRTGLLTVDAYDGNGFEAKIQCLYWVAWNDEALIHKYFPNGSDFDNDYELVDQGRSLSLPAINGVTAFEKLDGVLPVPCASAEFLEAVDEADGSLLVEYVIENGQLTGLRQQYIP